MQPRILSADETSEYLTEERCHILELANSPDDPEASVARARVKAGITTRKHRVVGTVERYVILSGRGEVHVEGLADQAVVPGDVVVIPAGAGQSISNIGSEDLLFLCVCTPRFEWKNYESLD
jgi:mannose-6-phosphate isomerase-like protein (cupin superfamily)